MREEIRTAMNVNNLAYQLEQMMKVQVAEEEAVTSRATGVTVEMNLLLQLILSHGILNLIKYCSI